ncbi:MAG: M56 family metallopeptidase [Candidatus Hydrogenedentes bacterium]|nr:M56 family metallopeptidase [Candidatus Hydrogenedentota bacterium]
MIASMNMVEALFDWVVLNSARASVLVVAVLALQLLTRRKLPPRWQYALWFVVIARLVIPAGLPSAWSVYNWAPEYASFAVDQMDTMDTMDPVDPVDEMDTVDTMDTAALTPGQTQLAEPEALQFKTDVPHGPETVSQVSESVEGNAWNEALLPEAAPLTAAPEAATAQTPFPWSLAAIEVFLPWFWLAGAALFAIIVLAANWRLLRAVLRQRLVTDTVLLTEFERCKHEMNIVAPVALVATNLRGDRPCSVSSGHAS